MVKTYLRYGPGLDTPNWIRKQHNDVFRGYHTFYMFYPILKRWILKTKQQHLKSARMKKGNRFTCKWCDRKSCNARMDTEDQFLEHITAVCMASGRYAFQTENEYRECRGWPAIDEEKNKISNEPSDNEPSGSKPSSSEPSGSEPSGNEPSGNEPSGNEPSGNEPSGNHPPEDQPAKLVSSKKPKQSAKKPKQPAKKSTQPAKKTASADKSTGDKPRAKRKATADPATTPKRVKKSKASQQTTSDAPTKASDQQA